MDQNQKEEFISQLSDDQYDALSKSSRVTNSQKEVFQKARNEARFDATKLTSKWDEASKSMVPNLDPRTGRQLNRKERALGNMNASRRAKLDDDVIVNLRGDLDPGDFDAVRRANKLNPEQRAEVGNYIADVLTDRTNPKHDEFDTYYQHTLSNANKNAWKSFYNLP